MRKEEMETSELDIPPPTSSRQATEPKLQVKMLKFQDMSGTAKMAIRSSTNKNKFSERAKNPRMKSKFLQAEKK